MKRFLVSILLVQFALAQQPIPPAPQGSNTPASVAVKPATTIVVPGTPVLVAVGSPVSSDKLKEKDLVGFVVLQDVVIDGRTVIREGARATAIVIHQRKSGRGHDGEVALNMNEVVAIDGATLPIRFAVVPRKGTKGETTTDFIATSPFLVYYSPILVPLLAVSVPVNLLHKGKPKDLDRTERYEVYVADKREVATPDPRI